MTNTLSSIIKIQYNAGVWLRLNFFNIKEERNENKQKKEGKE